MSNAYPYNRNMKTNIYSLQQTFIHHRENKNASCTTNRSRFGIRGRPCKNLPHVLFDRHAKFCFCFSYYVHVCRISSDNLADAGGPPLWDGAWLTPYKHTITPVTISSIHVSLPYMFPRSRSTRFSIRRVPRNFGDAGAPTPWDGGVGDP